MLDIKLEEKRWAVSSLKTKCPEHYAKAMQPAEDIRLAVQKYRMVRNIFLNMHSYTKTGKNLATLLRNTRSLSYKSSLKWLGT